MPQLALIVRLNPRNCCPTYTVSTDPKNPVDIKARRAGTATDAVNKDFHSHRWPIQICFLIRTCSAAPLHYIYIRKPAGRENHFISRVIFSED